MKKIVVSLIINFLLQTSFSFAQASANRYEVEILQNPKQNKKDTREVNSVIVFEKETVKIISRRNKQVFKEFAYDGIKSVEHSFSKNPLISNDTMAAILTVFTGLPLFLKEKERHWLTITADEDFTVLKLENDNYRLIKAEFEVRKFAVKDISESKK